MHMKHWLIFLSLIVSALPQAYSYPLDHVPKDVVSDGTFIYTISSVPPLLHVLDDNSLIAQIELPLAGSCLSIDKYSKLMAVGHDGWVTIIDYQEPRDPKIIDTYAIHAVASTVAISNPYVYIFPTGQWVGLICVDINTGELTKSSGTSFYGNTVGKIHPTQPAGYYLTRNLSPADMGKWTLTSPPAEESESPYHGDFSYGNNFWYSFDGSRVFSSSGNTFVASTDRQQDYEYQGSLGMLVTGVTQAVTSPYYIAALTNTGKSYSRWSWPFLNPISSVIFPEINEASFTGSFIFYSSDSSSLWIVGSTSVDGVVQWYMLVLPSTE